MRFIFFKTLYIMTLLSIVSSCKNNKSDADANHIISDSVNITQKSTQDFEEFNPEKPYPYPSGILEYKYTGNYEGNQKIYFKDHGRSYRVEEHYTNKITPGEEVVNQIFIKTPEKFVFYDKNTKKGYYVDSNDSDFQFQGNLLHDFTSIGIDSTMRKNGYKKSGLEEVSGKKCQIYKSEDGKSQFCFWNGINIKTEMNGKQFQYVLEAEKIDEKKVDDDLFSPESGIEILPYEQYVKSETKDKL